MSKTTGNVIDPLVVMDELGTDALRFTLLVGSSPGKDMNLSIKKVESNRNFANKLWNASRLVLGLLEQSPAEGDLTEIDWTLADSWIWARLRQLTHDADRLFTNYQYGEAGRQIYDFFWSEFADWYLEIAKLQVAEGGLRAKKTAKTLVRVLDQILRLLHPFTPFITEELWGRLTEAASDHGPDMCPPEGWEEALIVANWPEPHAFEGWEDDTIKNFELVMEIVRSIRNLRAEKQVKPGHLISATISAGAQADMLNAQAGTISALGTSQPGGIQDRPPHWPRNRKAALPWWSALPRSTCRWLTWSTRQRNSNAWRKTWPKPKARSTGWRSCSTAHLPRKRRRQSCRRNARS